MRFSLLLLSLACGSALACGYCVEDKIASTYDHAVVKQALAQKHHVAFFHVEGPLAPDSKRWLEAAAASVPGVDAKSVRAAPETLTLSLAFDPRRTSLVAVQSALDKKLAARRLSLMPLRIMESAAELKTVAR